MLENLDILSLHPEHHFTRLLSLKNRVVPMMYYDVSRLCSIFILQSHDDECYENTDNRENVTQKLNFCCFIHFNTCRSSAQCGTFLFENFNYSKRMKKQPCGKRLRNFTEYQEQMCPSM
jgi:hypothetical protein